MGLRRLFNLVLGAALAACLTAAAPAADPGRIVAIGDLHGDYEAWRKILLAAKLTDASGKWTGGAATLVQTGDITDRGPDSLKIIRHMMVLQRQAPRAKGNVVILLGNHEAMNVIGDLRYVSAGEYAAFADDKSAARRDTLFANNKALIEDFYRKRNASMSPAAIRGAWMATMPLGKAEHQAAWRPAGELGQWAIALPAVVKLGGTLFVHGGISAPYAALPIEEINRRAAAALAAADSSETAIISDPMGPLWYRGLIARKATGEAPQTPSRALPGEPRSASIDEQLTTALGAYVARRMVIGHTPVLSGIEITNNGRLIRIDTGISQAYGGKLSYLEILGDDVRPHEVAR
ncbi:metallophosphoesterase [Sphingomonas sp.]|uniref:metallophosphoesterase n=1 Tax=Sphingomonas sp. TaxID=28214 RepID=UPI00286D7195|nr:metallophosphoesterase [Sphingomonas sp.]